MLPGSGCQDGPENRPGIQSGEPEKYDGPLVRKKGDAYLVDCNVTGSSKGTEDKSQVLPEGRTSLRVKKYFRLLKSWFEVGTIKDIWQSSGGTMLDRIRREN